MTSSFLNIGPAVPGIAPRSAPGQPAPARPEVDFSEQFDIPADLAGWLGAKTLAKVVMEVTHAVEEQRLQPVFSFSERRLLQPWTMLTLVTYSYATGLHGSEQIAHRLMHDESFHSMFSDGCWDANQIRRFRDRNRDLIQQCLEKVCLLAWTRKFGRDPLPLGATAPARIHPLFKIQMICDVRMRLHCAEQADLLAAAA